MDTCQPRSPHPPAPAHLLPHTRPLWRWGHGQTAPPARDGSCPSHPTTTAEGRGSKPQETACSRAGAGDGENTGNNFSFNLKMPELQPVRPDGRVSNGGGHQPAPLQDSHRRIIAERRNKTSRVAFALVRLKKNPTIITNYIKAKACG